MDEIKLVALLGQAAADAAARLPELTVEELEKIREIEVDSKNRATLVAAIDRQIEALKKVGGEAPVVDKRGSSDPEQPTSEEALVALATPSPSPDRADEQQKPDPKSKASTVKMVRDAAVNPDGPHEADVHPDEVDTYRAGGWAEAPKK